jgi:hypothetical protein
MSFYLAAATIRARAIADTGSGGLFNVSAPLVKSCTHEYAPATDSATNGADIFPYIVFTFPAWEDEPTFTTDLQRLVVQFHVYALREGGSKVCGDILDRIYGDGIRQTTRIPTYGFHRHSLSLGDTDLTAPWTSGPMVRMSRNTAHERDVYHYIDSYSVTLARVKL